MKKWLIRGVIALVVLFIVVIAALSFNLNRLVKHAIETVGPQVTQVGVNVGSVVLLPLSGKGRIGGLVVGNPSGYNTPNAIKVGGASVSIDTGTIMDDKIVIHSINVSGPEITLEGGLKQNNLTKILDNIESYSAKTEKATGPDEADTAAPRKLQIDSVSITDAKVNLAIPMLKGRTAKVPLQDIRLTNLGQGPEGVQASEVSAQLMKQVLNQLAIIVPKVLAGGALEGLEFGADLTKEAGKLGIDLGKSGLEAGGKGAEAAGDLTKGAAKGAGKTVEGAAKGVGKGAEAIKEGVGGLLKGLKKK